jgi:hypothetical protein
MPTPRELLERYVEAKDFTRPSLMSAIYTPDAVLTYSIATDAISFPARTEGRDDIARVLVVDFAARYRECRTYYVCTHPPAADAPSVVVPWLVVMREPAAAALRIGKGFYRWTFTRPAPDQVRVSAMHIHIERMDPIADPQSQLMRSAQADLPYPWLEPATLRAAYEQRATSSAQLAFLRDFAEPIAIPPR